jgi:hypothetical protein
MVKSIVLAIVFGLWAGSSYAAVSQGRWIFTTTFGYTIEVLSPNASDVAGAVAVALNQADPPNSPHVYCAASVSPVVTGSTITIGNSSGCSSTNIITMTELARPADVGTVLDYSVQDMIAVGTMFLCLGLGFLAGK